jgi:hypothetical protein
VLLFRHAVYWFTLILVILIVGFWQTYFGELAAGTLPARLHIHAVAMIAWMLLLIGQAWLVRSGRFQAHRAMGWTSLALAPAVVISGLWVNFRFLQGAPDPIQAPGPLGAYWFAFFQMGAFVTLYALAIVERRKPQRHARYMAATALVFLTPGLGRALYNYVDPLIGWSPNALQLSLIPLAIGLWLLYQDARNGRDVRPYLIFNNLWLFGIVGRVIASRSALWSEVASWSARVQG